MKKLISAGSIVLNDKNQICLTFEHNQWFIPKGTPKGNETLEETAKREVMEETGLKGVQIIKKLGVLRRKSYEQGRFVDKDIHVFLSKTSQNVLKPMDKKHKSGRFDFDKAVSLLYYEEEKNFLIDKKNEILI